MTEVLPKVDAAVASILTKLQELTAAHGGEAVQLALKTIQADAAGGIAVGVVCAAATAYLVRLCRRMAVKASAADLGDEIFYVFGAVLFGIFSFFTGLTAAINLLEKWNWIALWAPELAAAHAIFEAVKQ